MKVGVPQLNYLFYLQLELHLVFSYGVWAKFFHNSKLDEQLMQGLQAIGWMKQNIEELHLFNVE